MDTQEGERALSEGAAAAAAAAPTIEQDTTALDTLSVDQLKTLCRKYGVKPTGKKDELIGSLRKLAREARWSKFEALDEKTVAELKDLATALGLDGKGVKKALHERLVEYLVADLKNLSDAELADALTHHKAIPGGTHDERVTRLQVALCERNLEARAVAASGGLVDREVPAGAQTIRICSWNVANMTITSRHKDYERIVHMLQQFDIIAMQEILKEDVLPFFVSKMPGYEFQMSAVVGKVRKEYYGFLFRTATIKCIQTGLFSDPKMLVERPPFVGTFSCLGAGKKPRFDFSLLTIHVLFGDAMKDRRGELGLLGQCAASVLASNGAEKDLFVLGDFNFGPDDDGWAELKKLGFSALFHPPVTTTVGDVSLYDNIWLQAKITGPNFVRRGVICFDKEWYPGKTLEARNEISDHRPVWAEFRSDIDLDDNTYGSLASLSIK